MQQSSRWGGGIRGGLGNRPVPVQTPEGSASVLEGLAPSRDTRDLGNKMRNIKTDSLKRSWNREHRVTQNTRVQSEALWGGTVSWLDAMWRHCAQRQSPSPFTGWHYTKSSGWCKNNVSVRRAMGGSQMFHRLRLSINKKPSNIPRNLCAAGIWNNPSHFSCEIQALHRTAGRRPLCGGLDSFGLILINLCQRLHRIVLHCGLTSKHLRAQEERILSSASRPPDTFWSKVQPH